MGVCGPKGIIEGEKYNVRALEYRPDGYSTNNKVSGAVNALYWRILRTSEWPISLSLVT